MRRFRGGLVVLQFHRSFAFFVFFVLAMFFVLSCADVLWEFVHKKNTRDKRVFFRIKVLRIIEHLALLFHATLINAYISFLTFPKLLQNRCVVSENLEF